MPRTVAALFAAPVAAPVALVAALSLSPAVAVPPGEELARSAQSRYQKQAFAATNDQRAKHDRARLRAQDCVQRFAVRQAKRMARQERIYHQALRPILRQCGLSTVGENVAYGYANGRAVVNDGWMHSAGHRRNILSPDYRLLGVGARKSSDGTWYAAQVFGRAR